MNGKVKNINSKDKNILNQIWQRSSDIVIAFVQPVGTDLLNVRNKIKESSSRVGAESVEINLTSVLGLIDLTKNSSISTELDNRVKVEVSKSNEFKELSRKMHFGTIMRKYYGNDFFAAYGLTKVFSEKTQLDRKLAAGSTEVEGNLLKRKRIFILDSLKHPDEVELLRDAYGDSFFLVGIGTDRTTREHYLKSLKGMTPEEVFELITRDEDEEIKNELGEAEKYGQNMTAVFEMADYFFPYNVNQTEVDRFIELLFGNTKIGPRAEEVFMHLAFSAATASCDLSRQVGATIVSNDGEILSIGTNEVPKAGGGQYLEESDPDYRDKVLGFDPNERRRELLKYGINIDDQKVKKIVESLTEFHRTVHAEMEALLSCARKGISSKGATLYTTTYPCHNCAKHLVGAGVKRISFVEGYPKSLAMELHGDSIMDVNDDRVSENNKMEILRYYGVGPRRFVDFFSQAISVGTKIKRKGRNVKDKWMASVFDAKNSESRFPLKFIQAGVIERGCAKALFKSNIFTDKFNGEINELIVEKTKGDKAS